MGVFTQIMAFKKKVKQGREKLYGPFVSIYGENVLTKNVSLSNVIAPLEIHS